MNFNKWMEELEYQQAVLYNNGSIAGARRRIETYGKAERLFKQEMDPAEAASVIKQHFAEEDERKRIKEEKEHKDFNDRMHKTFKRIERRAMGAKKVERPAKSLEYQLGYAIGESIEYRYLPSLSCEMMHTHTVIKVSDEDEAKYNELDNAWNVKRQNNIPQEQCEEEWKAYRDFAHALEEKYLPPVLKCYTHKIESIVKMDDFILGIRNALWNSDVCSYNTEKIEIVEDDHMFTKILIPLR